MDRLRTTEYRGKVTCSNTKWENIMDVRSLASLIAVLVLMGCVSPQERARRTQAQAEELLSAIQAQCRGYGFSQGTDAFAGCVQSEIRALETRATSRTAAPAPPGSCFGYCGPGGSSSGTPAASGYRQGTHTYFINGRTVTCTTTGTITDCF